MTLSATSTQTVTVQYATANGTATAGSDYTTTSGTLTFTPGQLTQTVPVPVLGDTVFEPTETFVVNLSNPINATIGDGQGARHHHQRRRRPAAADGVDRRRDGHGGQRGLGQRGLHRDPVGGEHADRDGAVRNGQRHGHGGSDYTTPRGR